MKMDANLIDHTFAVNIGLDPVDLSGTTLPRVVQQGR